MFATMLHLSENIKTIRELSEKTQLEFAELFGIKSKKGSYSSDKMFTYENGKAMPPAYLITLIADFAGVERLDLMNKKLHPSDIKFDENVLRRIKKESPEPDLIFRDKEKLYMAEAKFAKEVDYIESLKSQIKLLEKINGNLEKRLDDLELNLRTSLKNQELIQRQISVGFQLLTEQFVDDENKREEVLNEFDKLTFADRD